MTKMSETHEQEFLLQQVRRLEDDLLRAIQWQYHAISLVVYDTAVNGSRAVSLLEDRLRRRGQQVVHIAPDSKAQTTIDEEISLSKSWDDTVFFVMHISFNADEAIYQMISARSDFIINNRIRIVYWITENDFSTYISQIPETWLFEQRFYSLVDSINWESVWSRVGTRTWAFLKGKMISLQKPIFDELLYLDITDDMPGLIKRAQLLINYSLFYFVQREYGKASVFAEKAVELAEVLGDEAFFAKASLALLLLQIKTDQSFSSEQLQEKIAKKIDRRSASWVLLGSVYLSLFMFDKALDAFQNAVYLDRYNPSAFHGLGDVLLQQKKFDQAIAAFQKALDYQQNFSSAWYGLGKAYKAIGNYSKALECYQRSIEIDCRQPLLWFEISEISENDIAFLSIQRALELEPDNVVFWNALGNIQYHMKDYSDAVRSYYHVVSLEKAFGWSYANMALIYVQACQYEKATLLLTQSIKVFQNNFDKAHAYYRLGKVHQLLGNFIDSAHAFRQALLLFDDNNFLEKHISYPGPIHFGAPMREDSGEKMPIPSFSVANTHFWAPKEKLSKGKELPQTHEKVPLKAHKKVLTTKQQMYSISYWLELGAFYVKNRMYDLAEDAYRVAMEREPENGWAYYNLGRVYMFMGLYGDAVPLYEESIQLFTDKKDKALSWNQLGNAYRRLNEPSLAVAAYERAQVLVPVKGSMMSRARASLLCNCQA